MRLAVFVSGLFVCIETWYISQLEGSFIVIGDLVSSWDRNEPQDERNSGHVFFLY